VVGGTQSKVLGLFHTLSSDPPEIRRSIMSSDPKLDVALKILKLAGHQIGAAIIPLSQDTDADAVRFWIDGVPCILEDVVKMAEEEIKESEQPG
jgi:hypothetical protein